MADGPYYAKGRYRAQVKEQALGQAQTGTTQFAVKVTILECLTPLSEVSQYDRTIYLAITDKTMEYVVPKLQGIGYTRDSLKYLDPKEPNHHSFVGQEIEVFCNHENNRDGVLQEKWDIARQGSKPLDVKPADKNAIRTLDMLFSRAVKQSGGASAARSPIPQSAPRSTPDLELTDSDCPF